MNMLKKKKPFPNIWSVQVFSAVSKQNPIVYSAARERAENTKLYVCSLHLTKRVHGEMVQSTVL